MKSIFKSVALLLSLVSFLPASLQAQESRLENNRTFVFDTSSMLFVAVSCAVDFAQASSYRGAKQRPNVRIAAIK